MELIQKQSNLFELTDDRGRTARVNEQTAARVRLAKHNGAEIRINTNWKTHVNRQRVWDKICQSNGACTQCVKHVIWAIYDKQEVR